MWAIFRKELRLFFTTPVAFIAIGVFWLTINLFLWVIPGQWNVLDAGYANVDGLFAVAPWLFILLCPALTMNLFIEEKQTQTWEILLTKPISIGEIVLGKFFAVWLVVLLAVLPNAVHYFITYFIAEPVGNVDGAQFFCSLAGLVLLNSSMLAICTFVASVSVNQIMSFIVGVACCFTLQWTVFKTYFDSLARGVVDLCDIAFFVSVTIFAIAITSFVLKR